MNRCVFETHYPRERFRYCPICQKGIDEQHEEAGAQNTGALPPEFNGETIAAMFLVDRIGLGPTDTQPYDPVDPAAGPPVDFTMVEPEETGITAEGDDGPHANADGLTDEDEAGAGLH